MKFLLPLALCGLFCTNFIYAQLSSPEKASVVLTNGDTLSGMINRDSDFKLSKGITFINNQDNSAPIRLKPADLQEFTFLNTLKTFRVITHNYRDIDTETKIEEKRMAYVLFEGYVKLYKFYIEPGESGGVATEKYPYVYYIQKSGPKPFKLSYLVQRLDDGTHRFIPKYKTDLAAIMSEWPDVTYRVKTLKFNDQSMVKFVAAFSEHMRPENPGVTLMSSTKERRVYHRVKLQSALSSNVPDNAYFDLAYGGGYYFTTSNPEKSNSFDVGLGFEFLNFQYRTGQEAELSRTYSGVGFRVPFLAQFYFSKQSFVKPYLHFSFTPSTTVFQREEFIIEYELTPNGDLREIVLGYIPMEDRTTNIVLGAGLGIEMGRWGLSYKYERALQHLISLECKLN